MPQDISEQDNILKSIPMVSEAVDYPIRNGTLASETRRRSDAREMRTGSYQ